MAILATKNSSWWLPKNWQKGRVFRTNIANSGFWNTLIRFTAAVVVFVQKEPIGWEEKPRRSIIQRQICSKLSKKCEFSNLCQHRWSSLTNAIWSTFSMITQSRGKIRQKRTTRLQNHLRWVTKHLKINNFWIKSFIKAEHKLTFMRTF